MLNQTWPSDMVTLNLLSLHCYSKSYSRTYWFKTMDIDYLTRTQWTRDFGKLYLRNICQFSVWITAPRFKLSLALAWKTGFKVVHWYKWQVSAFSGKETAFTYHVCWTLQTQSISWTWKLPSPESLTQKKEEESRVFFMTSYTKFCFSNQLRDPPASVSTPPAPGLCHRFTVQYYLKVCTILNLVGQDEVLNHG